MVKPKRRAEVTTTTPWCTIPVSQARPTTSNTLSLTLMTTEC